MREIPLSQRPSFRSIILAVLLGAIYLYNFIWNGGIWQNALGVVFDLILLALLYQVYVFFYAQFTLPIHALHDRKKIASRLRLHAKHAHGPAIFVKNGRRVERAGESDIRGPGVLWIDTASAVVTRTVANFDRVLGPGVHFIEASEQIASVISLHTQTQTIGPLHGEAPFRKLGADATEEERRTSEATHARSMAVRAMTRDGIEVIPNITVTFKIDAKPAYSGKSGSRFGFNSEAVEKAARSEGINPNSTSEEKRRVAWNQLPALIAADLWREYLSKFTLDELFDPHLPDLPDLPQPEAPLAPIDLRKPPFLTDRSFATRILRNINNSFESKLERLIPEEAPPAEEEVLSTSTSSARPPGGSEQRTALQVISQMMKARMSQAVVAKLDECGRLMDGREISTEYKQLKDRGVAVLGVDVTSLYFNEAVESQLLDRWTTNWLSHARSDQSRVERLNLAYGEQGRQRAALDHSLALSQALVQDQPSNLFAAVKTLLQRTQSEIRLNDRLLTRIGADMEALDDVVRWVDEVQI